MKRVHFAEVQRRSTAIREPCCERRRRQLAPARCAATRCPNQPRGRSRHIGLILNSVFTRKSPQKHTKEAGLAAARSLPAAENPEMVGFGAHLAANSRPEWTEVIGA